MVYGRERTYNPVSRLYRGRILGNIARGSHSRNLVELDIVNILKSLYVIFKQSKFSLLRYFVRVAEYCAFENC